MDGDCPDRYYLNSNGQCIHYIWPLSLKYGIGLVVLVFANGLATIAGIGGGGVGLPIMMLFFDYTAKDATFVILCSILGAAYGNISNLMRKAVNGKALIQYHYVFVIIPIMFTGSFIGIFLNKYLPSVAVCSLIMFIILLSVKKTYVRFTTNYQKQTQQLLNNEGRQSQILQEEQINPFTEERNVYIAKNLAVIVLITMGLSMIRGSEKFPSIVGVEPCSGTYWVLYVFSFVLMGCISYRNIKILRAWLAPEISRGEEIKEYSNAAEQNVVELVNKSILAGILSGFGLGGGIVLVPTLRAMGLNPLQATSSCSLCIFITSFINCIQGIFIGVILPSQFIFYVCFLGVCGYFTSRFISGYLRRKNRLSLAEGIFLVLILLALINIPFSLYRKYVNNDYNADIILGFGSLC